MILKNIAAFIFCLQSTFLLAQVPFGHEKAIYKDSSIFVSWATGCTVDRGFQNISDSFLGLASTGDSSLAIGKADGSGVVSLGDAGTAILSFQSPITNGVGYDFAVFENGFSFGVDSLFFLELAFVEVSSDGQHYFRFPSTSLTDTIIQIDNASGINPKGISMDMILQKLLFTTSITCATRPSTALFKPEPNKESIITSFLPGVNAV